MRAIITAIDHYAPDRKLTNADLEKIVDTSDEWITTRTGIRERRILEKDKGTSYMAVNAARKVLDQRDISGEQLDLIIVATVTPDMCFPQTAALVQKALNAGHCGGFDVSAGCAGFLNALATGATFIESGRYQKVMVIGADKMSSIIDYEDRNTCVLFGDAAGAVLLEPTENTALGVGDYLLHLDGGGEKYLYMTAGGSRCPATLDTVGRRQHYLRQDGKPVFKRAVKEMAQVSARILEKNNLTPKDVKLLIPHQANARIIDAVGQKLHLAPEQVVVNIKKYGNTTAATIPMAMSEAFQKGLMKKGDLILLTAFGSGYSWGSMLLRWAI